LRGSTIARDTASICFWPPDSKPRGVDVGLAPRAARGQHHVLAHAELPEDAHVLGHVGDAALRDIGRGQLRDVLLGERDAAGRGLPQAHDRAQRGGLARAVSAEQQRGLAGRDLEVHAVQDVIRADVRVHAGEGQQRPLGCVAAGMRRSLHRVGHRAASASSSSSAAMPR
jgi:hypothetical protein